jgi:hypothetical protein
LEKVSIEAFADFFCAFLEFMDMLLFAGTQSSSSTARP